MEGAYDIVDVALGNGFLMRDLAPAPRNEVTPGWSPSGGVYAYATDRPAPEIWLKSQQKDGTGPSLRGAPWIGDMVAYYSNRGRCSGCTRRRMDRACPGVLSMRPLRSRVLIIS